MNLPISVFSIRTISIAVALVSVSFFAARLTRYANRPTFGFETYYTSATLLSLGIPAEVLYDNSEFIRQRAQKTGVDSREPFVPNPPAAAILFIPLTLVPLPVAKVVWECLSLGFLLGFFMIIKKEENLDSVESLALIAFAFAFTPLYMNFVYGQMYALLLLLLSCMFWAWHSKRDLLTAFFLASLLLLKGFGAFLVLLLVFRKEWMVLGLTFGMVLAGIAVSAAFIGIGVWSSYGASIWETLSHLGLSSVIQRNLVGLVGTITDIAVGPTVALSAGLIAGSAGILFWFNRRTDPDDFRAPFGVAVILSLLCSPIIADYHYVLLLLPLFFLYDRLRHGFSKAQLSMFAAALFLVSTRFPLTSGTRGTLAGLLTFSRVYGSLLLLILFLIPFLPGSNRQSVAFSAAMEKKQ
jgi:hypothetical protein